MLIIMIISNFDHADHSHANQIYADRIYAVQTYADLCFDHVLCILMIMIISNADRSW